jgi:hypothetical protein
VKSNESLHAAFEEKASVDVLHFRATFNACFLAMMGLRRKIWRKVTKDDPSTVENGNENDGSAERLDEGGAVKTRIVQSLNENTVAVVAQ